MGSVWAVALLLVSGISGDRAVALAKASFAQFGVKEALSLHLVTQSQESEKEWYVVLADAQGKPFRAVVAPDGGIRSLHLGRDFSWMDDGSPVNLSGTVWERRARAWLAQAGVKEEVQLESLVQNEAGMGRAFFAILRNGYPFVNEPRFGYEFVFDYPSGALRSFNSIDRPPPVDPRPPKVEEETAVAALQAEWKRILASRSPGNRPRLESDGAPELGYFLPTGKKRAVLVWSMRYSEVYGCVGMTRWLVIDAVSGQPLATDPEP